LNRSFWGWILVCILSFASLATGQTASTSLRGVVKDASGALVPGATIALSNKATGKSYEATSNAQGYYTFPVIAPARYQITVTSTGFATQHLTAEFLVNQPATLDIALSIEASSVTIDVSSTVETLNQTDASIGNSVGNITIEALPMEGRDPVSLLTLQPGVLYLGNPEENATNDSRSGSVNGGRSDQGNITLDGMDDNDQIGGKAFTGVLRATLDSTEEFRVTTANGTAESGRGSGAQVVLVTKSGTNRFKGSLYEYHRPTNAVANDWFHKYTQLSQGEANIPQKYVMNTFGGSIGGPIKKDKLFFFFNYEGMRKAISDVVTRTVPTKQFYEGSLGYLDTTGATKWIDSTAFAKLDSDCVTASTGVACGVNPNVQKYWSSLSSAGIYGTAATAGDAINNAGYIFASPAPATQNTSIVKLDYTINDKQHVFFRGNLQKDTTSGDEQFPGQGASHMVEDNSKGFAAGHTWMPTANIVNDLRYGITRQGNSDHGVGTGTGDWVNFRFLDQPTSHTRSTVYNVPVHNIADTLTWTKGKHTFSFGANWRMITNNRSTDANSYSSASTNPYWLSNAPNDPGDVNDGFGTSYEIAYATLVGTVPQTTEQFNYQVKTATGGIQLADGATVSRHFRSQEYEWYVQDTWHMTPTITVTYGVRHSLLQAPYETNGQQVAPTVDMDAWFRKRGSYAAEGKVFEDYISFAPAGKANHAPGYWSKQKANFAPRLSVAWAPDAKTTVRAGAGMYYDHFGEGIVNSFDQRGSFGLSTSIQTPASTLSFQDSPRFTGAHNIGSVDGASSAAGNVSYPYTPPAAFAIMWGINNKLKTPYSYSLDFSVQRQLNAGLLVEANYIGRLGRHLLEQVDLAEPVNLVDAKGGGDYFTAAAKLGKMADERGGKTDSATIGAITETIPYVEHVFDFMAGQGHGDSATQNAYYWFAKYRYNWGATTSLDVIDYWNNKPQFWQDQFSSLYAWSSIGTSSYNALQLVARHPMSHGLSFDLNYTFSKSIDMGSAVERSNYVSSDSFGGSAAIQNSWNPKLNKSVSDFDTKHLVSLDWVYQLPVGRGKKFLGNSGRIMDAALGQWSFSGLSRWASGLPFSIYEPGYTTNWELSSATVQTGNVKVKKHMRNGVPQVFAGDTADTINSGMYAGGPLRLPYAGEAGQRNKYRGDGYIDVDSTVSKVWTLPAQMKLKFAAEVYNIANNVRFDDSPLNLGTSLGQSTLGIYSGTLSTYRRMQFGLRLDF